ncbi:MAG: polysaccharide lyase 6 family protein [Bacteroidia bacterium]|nr:polysaccharide lyase 6 family protein [Bacteroidia bacterium]
MAEFRAAVANAKPGDKILLANGVWNDAEFVFQAQGTEAAPITLSVEEKGKVFIEGKSNLKIAGEYLVVEGLVFRNGYTPTSEVISFRVNENTLANHCRVTECVIDSYNNPERFESDLWVAIYGKNNRFDHNELVGKGNLGVTVAVRLNTPESQQNFHQIDHNYFGPREILGSNGGETLRIGTSHYSLTNSNTLVEYNYFDRCNGEHEIISNKSCQNVFRNNTFFECQGTLTMRHGNETLVENNFFFGNRKANTGGIRIINESQRVINNYCEGLTGYRFRGALVIMNGVPNSTPNRYFQVKNSEATSNTFIDCDYIQLCAGSDEERSAVPVNTSVSNNLFLNKESKNIFTVYDDISGITFQGNVLGEGMEAPTSAGFVSKSVALQTQDGIKISSEAGIKSVEGRATLDNTGVAWYQAEEISPVFGTGTVIKIEPGEDAIFNAVAQSKAGDIIELSQGGKYLETKSIDLIHTLTIRGSASSEGKPEIQFEKSTLFNIENGGALSLQGVLISGASSPDQAGNAVIRTSRYSMVQNYKLMVKDCDFRDLDVNHSFNVLKIFKNTFADSISLVNSTFTNITGSVLSLNEETEDLGIYNVENVEVEGCTFSKIGGVAIDLYRGGSDESTFGPILNLSNSSFDEVGLNKRNKSGASITLHGVQLAMIHHNTFTGCSPIKLHMVVGDPVTVIEACEFTNTPAIQDNGEPYEVHDIRYN